MLGTCWDKSNLDFGRDFVVDHIGVGCHLYAGGVIEADKAPYGSWLQAEVKRATRRNLRGRRFGLDQVDVSADAEFSSEKDTPQVPTEGGTSGMRIGKECLGDSILTPESRDLQSKTEILAKGITCVDQSSINSESFTVPNSLSAGFTESVTPVVPPPVEPVERIDGPEPINFEASHGPVPSSPVVPVGPLTTDKLDPFNLSPLIRKICGPLEIPYSRPPKHFRRQPQGDRHGSSILRPASSGVLSGVKRDGLRVQGADLVQSKRPCVLSSPSHAFFQLAAAVPEQPRRSP